jgi:hypothetical protein
MLAPLHQETDRAGLPITDHMISQDLTDDPDPEIARVCVFCCALAHLTGSAPPG